MNDPQILVESIKGLWAVIGVFATGLCTWIGFAIKERISKKKKEDLYREEQAKKQLLLEQKVDKLTEIFLEFSNENYKRLNKISEGLELCMEDDDLIFRAFRKTKILNGDSEAQSKKLEKYRQALLHESFIANSDISEDIKDTKKDLI